MVKKLVNIILLVFLVAGAYQFSLLIESGYDMFDQAVSKTSIEDKVNQIRSKSYYIGLEDLPKTYLQALIISEDKRFYNHDGIDVFAIGRAVFNDLRALRFVEGGSTITQQIGKNMYFSFEKKLERKVAEVFLASALEEKYSKNELLELYVNMIYFGEGCYGIKNAANHYYQVEPHNLTPGQIAILVRTIKSPNNYNPNAIAKRVNNNELKWSGLNHSFFYKQI